VYRCTLGCDFDVCSVCHAAAHASATRAIAAREGPGWRLATQEDVETHGAALAQDANPTAAVSSFALAGGRVAQVERPRGLSGGPGSRYFCSASSPHCDGLPRLLTLTLALTLTLTLTLTLAPTLTLTLTRPASAARARARRCAGGNPNLAAARHAPRLRPRAAAPAAA
jgi:hypothetical protein